MKNHPQKSFLQAEASALLSELSWVSPSCVAAIAENGCLELVRSSMQCHGTNLKVQQMACGFFRGMSYDFANHHIIASVDGVGTIIDSMKRNTKQYDVLKEGCYFLQNILCNPEITCETIECVSFIIPIIIDALCEKIDDAEYTGAACGVLANLAIHESAREHIVRYNLSIPTLLSVVRSGIDKVACKYSLMLSLTPF